MSGGYLTDSVDVYYRPKTEYTGRRMFLKKRKSYEYKGEEESHEHTGMERMKELISLIGSTCFEGAVKGVKAAITREEHVTTRWP